MAYSKPNVTKLGGALSTVQGTLKPPSIFLDVMYSVWDATIGAYESDE
jgi:hypothetical protein